MIRLLTTVIGGGGWGFFLGADEDTPLQELTHISMDGKFLFKTRREAVLAAQAMLLRVDEDGVVSIGLQDLPDAMAE